jgi:hypothetical protein
MLYPEYAKHTFIDAGAAMSASTASEEKAKDYGLLVLIRPGESIVVMSQEGFELRVF